MAGALYSEASVSVVRALRRARLDAGLHQAELAKRIGKDQTFVSNIERGQRRVDVIELYAIARALGVDPQSLFGDLIADLPGDVSDLLS